MLRTTHGGVTVAHVSDEGPAIGTEQDALDLVGALYGFDVDLVAIPVARLRDDVLQLRTGLLGGFVQKLTNYRLRVAFVGDVSARVEASESLRAYVVEANRGGAVIFAASGDDLARRLGDTP